MEFKFIDFEEILDQEYGKIGTPKRDAFEKKVLEDVIRELLIERQREKNHG